MANRQSVQVFGNLGDADLAQLLNQVQQAEAAHANANQNHVLGMGPQDMFDDDDNFIDDDDQGAEDPESFYNPENIDYESDHEMEEIINPRAIEQFGNLEFFDLNQIPDNFDLPPLFIPKEDEVLSDQAVPSYPKMDGYSHHHNDNAPF